MTRRFWIGLALALPVFLLEMGGHLIPALHHLVPMHISIWIQFALATPVVLWAGWPFFERGWTSVRTRNLNMFTLIAMGTGVAWGYSMVAALAPGLFPPAFRHADGTVAVYFEAAAVITVLVLLGQVLELRARETTSGAIRALLDRGFPLVVYNAPYDLSLNFTDISPRPDVVVIAAEAVGAASLLATVWPALPVPMRRR